MFTHSFVSALAIAATFSQAALGASDSGRQIARLARRDGQTSVEGNAFISAWSNLSPAFSQCHQTIQSHVEASASIQTHVEVSAAMEAVNNLAIQATAVASQYGSIDGHFAAEGPHACIPCVNQYKEIVSQQFLSLQAIMSLGVQTYGQQWKSSFGPSCERFGSFIKVVNSICMSLNINLGGLIVDMHIDQHLFIEQGINLNYLVTGLVGSNGLLGGDIGSGGQGGLLGGGAEGGLLGDVLR